MKKRKTSAALALALMVMLLLTACGPKNPGTVEPGGSTPAPSTGTEVPGGSDNTPAGNESDTLRILIPSEPSVIMPLAQEAGDGQWVAWCMYDRLINYDSETGQLVPGLANSWEWIDDTHLQFNLRDDAVAYDGTIITANDVMFSVEQGLSGDATTKWNSVDGSECSVKDENTFVLGLKEPYPSITGMLSYVTSLVVIDESSCEALGGYEAAIHNPRCTSGAYFFEEWKPGEYIRLVRNEDYWGQPGYYKYLEFSWITDTAARTMAIASGDADFAVDITNADVVAAGGYADCQTIMLGGGGTNLLFFNVTNEYLSNELVRKAIFYAVDATACNMIGTGGTSRVADSIMASTVSYYKAPDANTYDRSVDIEKAKELLAQAGYPDGFELSMPVIAKNQAVCEAVQASLLQIGIKLNINLVEIPTFLGATDTGDFDIVFQPTFCNEVVSYAKYFDDRMELNARGGGIIGGYSEMYSMLDRCKYSIDEADNMAAWGELQDYVREHCLAVPLYETSVFYCTNGAYTFSNFSNGHINFATVAPAN